MDECRKRCDLTGRSGGITEGPDSARVAVSDARSLLMPTSMPDRGLQHLHGVVVALAVTTFPVLLMAQSAAPDMRVMTMVTSGNGPQCQSPSIAGAEATWSHIAATAYSAPVASTTRFGTATPTVAVTARTPARAGWSLAASGAVGRGGSDCLDLSHQPRAQLQLQRAVPGGGVSLGYGYRSLSALDPTRDQQGVTLSVWRNVWRAKAAFDMRALDRSVSLEREGWQQSLALYRDSASARWSARQIVRAVDLRTRLQFHAGPVLLDITGGSTVRERGRSLPWISDTMPVNGTRAASRPFWGRTEAQVPVTRWLKVRAGVAALPTLPETRSPVHTVYSMAVQLGNWRRSDRASPPPADSTSGTIRFEAIIADSSQLRLRLRHPDASSVRVSGEPTRWMPVSMTRQDGEWWEVTLPAGPGTYRLNISIDDAPWQPPPGLPTARDEFGGRVGVVTVR